MSTHSFTALVPVTATGKNEADAREYARGLLDNTLQRMDDEHPAGNLSTGDAILIDPVNLRQLLTLIRDDANALATGAALTRTAPAARIRQRADEALAALDQAASPAGRDAA